MTGVPEEFQHLRSALDEKMGVELTELSATRVVASMPVEGNTQPFGLLHGGASAVLIETLGSLGTMVHGHPERVPVGVDLNVTHLKPGRSGRITGVATPVRLGRTTAVWQAELRDEDGDLTAVGRLTCQLVEPRR